MTTPWLSAMVSTYASERFLPGCLDDLLAQSLGERLEILVVDACSPEREGEIVRAYQQRHANIHYLRTEVRECSSAAFNRAAALAHAPYLTTANTDDRHHPEFAARMVAVLEQCPQYGLVYADSAITRTAHETWATTTATRRFAWPDFTPAVALSCCLFGAQPVWRKDAHRAAGPWSTSHRIANDQDMFLRIARVAGAVHLDEVLGVFLQRDDSVAGSGRREAVLADALAVMKQHRHSWSIDEIVPGATAQGPFAEAAAWFELGNLCALGPYTDAAAALDCYRTALALPLAGAERAAVQAAFANNSGCVLACAGIPDAARRAFAASAPGPLRDHNLALCLAGDRVLQLRDLRFAELGHPLVARSRRTHGVRVDAAGRVQTTASHEQVPWDVFTGPNGVPWAGAARPTAASTAGLPR